MKSVADEAGEESVRDEEDRKEDVSQVGRRCLDLIPDHDCGVVGGC